jgi:hypothetical protein
VTGDDRVRLVTLPRPGHRRRRPGASSIQYRLAMAGCRVCCSTLGAVTCSVLDHECRLDLIMSSR